MGLFAIIALIVSVVSSAVQMRKQQKAQKKAKEDALDRAGFQITVKGDSAPIPIVYGRQVVGGVLADVVVNNDYVWADTPNRDSGWSASTQMRTTSYDQD